MKSDAKRTKGDILLEIKGLQISGQSDDVWHEIVKGVDLTLRRGEVLGLIGESGAGKSTIGLAAMGFARPGCRITSGSIVFDGKDLRKASEEERRALRGSRIAYVAQSAAASFNPAHRIIDQTVETAVGHEVLDRSKAEADAKDLYTRLKLPNPNTIGSRYPHQVSGGQLQRAMTAMAMSCRPDLIIFDEPTTALDVTTQVDVLAAMRDIVEQFNTAAIYITHDLAVVAQMAHRIMVLRYGKLVEEAPTREMLKSPKEAYTKTLWAVRGLAMPERVGKDMILRVHNVEATYGGIIKVL
ncbi:MAG: ABC transporter ATP-binding protein, partial [Alphaproteobacteria bacterium]